MGWFLFPYLTLYFFHLLLFHHFASCTSWPPPLCNPAESIALLQFKSSFVHNSSPYQRPYRPYFISKTETWENGTNCCLWDGVTCDTESGHVISLDLSFSLRGELHPNSTIFQLTHLQKLNLAFNDIGSLLSSGFGDLVHLTHLNLSNSGFNGDIPSKICHLSKLVSLDQSPELRPDLPFETLPWSYVGLRMRLDPSTWKKLILNTTDLRELFLDGVDMSSIKPDSLSLLMNMSSSLVSLGLQRTGLLGNLPSNVLSLPNLQHLDLSDNRELKGQLPKSNWSIPLRYLHLSSTNFSGEIPDSIGQLIYLTVLNLEYCNFHGLIPLSLGNLTQLTFLSLGGNHFSGHIPNIFGKLIKLESASLDRNNLTGLLPSSLFSLTQLFQINLSKNAFVGPIPNKITNSSKLLALRLGDNFLNGTIPLWCYSLTSLQELSLHNNQLTGTIGEFSTYTLNYLSLSNNKLQGNIPSSIFKFENPSQLDLSSNNFSGLVDFHIFSKFQIISLSGNKFLSFEISVDYILPKVVSLNLSSCYVNSFPNFIAQLENLDTLDLSNSRIHGRIPKWFYEKLSLSRRNMRVIDLSFNMLQGDLPTPPRAAYFFSISNNNLIGDISSEICNASYLKLLNLSHNNLTGLIPQCLGTLPFLSVLDLRMNNLHGVIPSNYSERNAFQTINFNGNQLRGPLPRSLAHCSQLEVLDLGGNYIEDTFPNWLGTLQMLKVLVLRANKFHSNITSFTTKPVFPMLRIFDVSNNNFSGPLPASFIKNFKGMMNADDAPTGLNYLGKGLSSSLYYDSVRVVYKGVSIELERILTTFTNIDLSNNMFEGEIPTVMGELNSLKGLNLSHNVLTGTIPQSLGNLANLEWLDLSRNKLKGVIPVSLTNLNFLSMLNLSQNQLEGTIPTGKQFNTFGNDSYLGNPMLCGLPLSKSCNKEPQPPDSTFQHEDGSLFGWKVVAVGYACGTVFGMLLGYIVFTTGKPQWLARSFGVMPTKRVRRKNMGARANVRGAN